MRFQRVRQGSASGSILYRFSYDANGNVTHNGKQAFSYTHIDLPSLVSRSTSLRTEFKYGPARELVWRRDTQQGQVTTRWQFPGYEPWRYPMVR